MLTEYQRLFGANSADLALKLCLIPPWRCVKCRSVSKISPLLFTLLFPSTKEYR